MCLSTELLLKRLIFPYRIILYIPGVFCVVHMDMFVFIFVFGKHTFLFYSVSVYTVCLQEHFNRLELNMQIWTLTQWDFVFANW